MKSFFKTIGFGFGLAMGGATAYALLTSETARLYIFSFGAFILGAIIIGLAIIYANRTLLNGLFGRERRETTNVNYRFPQHPADRALAPPSPWGGYPYQQPALPSPDAWQAPPHPPEILQGGNSNYVNPSNDDEFVA